MPIKNLRPNGFELDNDWEGNNVAFACPVCEKIFIVSELMHKGPNDEKGYRRCPKCTKSIGRISGGKKSGGTASIEW